MFIDGMLSTVYIPLSCAEQQVDVPVSLVEPKFGEIRFAAIDHIVPAIDYKSDDFDGWLWMNSSIEYELTAFRLADKIQAAPFVKSMSGGKFKVKDADCFFKVDCANDIGGKVNYHNSKAKHIHRVDLQVDGYATCSADVKISTRFANGGNVHRGDGITNNKAIDASAKAVNLDGNDFYEKPYSNVVSYKISSLSYYGDDPKIRAMLDDPLSSYRLWGEVL